ncbi:hypothetical protein PanWU01x14_199070, partial [Parasponia andersonii]
MVVMVVLTLYGILPKSLSDASQSVPAEQKGKIIHVVEEFFEYIDLDDDNDDLANVRDGTLRTAANIYNNWRTELNKYFTLIRGDKNALDLAMPRFKVPNEMDVAIWGYCCDLFDSLEFR